MEEKRNWRDILQIDLILSTVFSAVVYTIVSLIATNSLASPSSSRFGTFFRSTFFLPIATLLFILILVILFDLCLRRLQFRTALLILSQRRGSIITAFVFIIFLLFGAVWIDIFLLPDVIPIEKWGFAAFSLCATIWAAYRLMQRNHINESDCDFVLRKIDRQIQTRGTLFVFDDHLPNVVIRRQSRILDFIAWQDRRSHSRDFMIIRRRLGYVITKLQEPAPVNRRSQLNHWAHDIWQTGLRHHRWTPRDPFPIVPEEDRMPIPRRVAKSGEFEPIFGNQLDYLFNSGKGYRFQRGQNPQFVTMVIKGPPGAGKSTLALQMCVTLARKGNICIYYSLEEEEGGLVQSAQDFGWLEHEKIQIRQALKDEQGNPWVSLRTVDYRGVLQASDLLSRETIKSTSPEVGGVLVSSLGERAMDFNHRKAQLVRAWTDGIADEVEIPQVVRCVVIDSLEGFANVGHSQEGQFAVPREQVLDLKKFFRDRCDMLVILVEDDGSGKPGFVDYLADAVIQLGRKVEEDYTILTVEINKARNQKHALGPSQMKIRSRQDIANQTGAIAEKYLKVTPGILVFPSLHYRLYKAQQSNVYSDHVLSFGIAGLDEMITGVPYRAGLNRQDMTAVLGPAGTGKSLIAMNFLIEGVRENTRTMYLSLRENAEVVKKRSVHQDEFGLRFGWKLVEEAHTTANNVDGQAHDKPSIWYHELEWDLEGVRRWAKNWRDNLEDTTTPPPEHFRLPYLFEGGAISYKDFKDDTRLQEQARAVTAFLLAVADAGPTVTDKVLAQLWESTFIAKLTEQHLADSLVQVGDAPLTSSVHPKRIELRTSAGQPERRYLYWNSMRWKRVEHSAQYQREYDTSLMTIKDWRPGNVTPEEFFDVLFRELVDQENPDQQCAFERIVFDDISQLKQRFPLLARSSLFLPTLVDLFKANGITAMFLADTEDGVKNEATQGITVIADHVIRSRVAYARPIAPGETAQPIVLVDFQPRPDYINRPRQLYISPQGQKPKVIDLRPVPALQPPYVRHTDN